MSTLYDVLDIDRSASPEEIRRSYRRLAKELHPDHAHGDPAAAGARFRRLQAAYEILSDPQARRRYDDSLEEQAPPRPPGTASAEPGSAENAASRRYGLSFTISWFARWAIKLAVFTPAFPIAGLAALLSVLLGIGIAIGWVSFLVGLGPIGWFILLIDLPTWSLCLKICRAGPRAFRSLVERWRDWTIETPPPTTASSRVSWAWRHRAGLGLAALVATVTVAVTPAAVLSHRHARPASAATIEDGASYREELAATIEALDARLDVADGTPVDQARALDHAAGWLEALEPPSEARASHRALVDGLRRMGRCARMLDTECLAAAGEAVRASLRDLDRLGLVAWRLPSWDE